jgi:hypothetical protein
MQKPGKITAHVKKRCRKNETLEYIYTYIYIYILFCKKDKQCILTKVPNIDQQFDALYTQHAKLNTAEHIAPTKILGDPFQRHLLSFS